MSVSRAGGSVVSVAELAGPKRIPTWTPSPITILFGQCPSVKKIALID